MEAGQGDLFWDLSLQEAQGFFLAAFDVGSFSIISITLNPENPLGFLLSCMASSVGKLSSLVRHSSVPFYNHLSPCIHD